jgi:hypothetical protein
MLNVIMLSAIMPNVVILSVGMLNVECRGAGKMLVEFLWVQNKNVQLKFLFQLSPFHPTNFMLTFFLDNEES